MERIKELIQYEGGDAKRNAEILLSVLKSEARSFLGVTVLDAGLGFMPMAGGFYQGEVALAREVIASGAPLRGEIITGLSKMSQNSCQDSKGKGAGSGC